MSGDSPTVGHVLGWGCITVGAFLLLIGLASGLLPSTSETGSCGSAWIRTDPANGGCGSSWYAFSMWLSLIGVGLGSALVLSGVALVRRFSDRSDLTGVLRR